MAFLHQGIGLLMELLGTTTRPAGSMETLLRLTKLHRVEPSDSHGESQIRWTCGSECPGRHANHTASTAHFFGRDSGRTNPLAR